MIRRRFLQAVGSALVGSVLGRATAFTPKVKEFPEETHVTASILNGDVKYAMMPPEQIWLYNDSLPLEEVILFSGPFRE